MGVSFKISKTGRRLRPKLSRPPPQVAEDDKGSNGAAPDENPKKLGDFKTLSISSILSSISSEQQISPDYEVSFTLNLFPDGFFIGKPNEAAKMQNPLQDGHRLVHPYNRASETLFSAIELGCLPGDILDDMPSKYYNGAIVCEVRDFRNCMPEQGASSNVVPFVKKVLLRMSLENIVRDIPSISDVSWTYGDLMEIESRVLKALQPKLCLDPKPKLDRLCKEPTCNKLNLSICGFKRKVQPGADVTITSNIQTHGKKVCIDRAGDGASHESGDLGMVSGHSNMQLVNENPNLQHNSSATQTLRTKTLALDCSTPTLPVSSQSHCHPSGDQPRVHGSLPMGSPGLSDLSPYTDNFAGGIHGKREAQDMQLTNVAIKRSKQTLIGQEGNQQLSGLQVDGAHGEIWRNTMLRQQLEAKGMQYPPGMTGKRPAVVGNIPNPESGGSFHPHQQDMKIGMKQEQPDTDKLKHTLHTVEAESNPGIPPPQLRHHQLAQQAFLTQFTQHQLNNLGPAGEKEARKEDILQRRKAAQSHHISPAATLVQSPVSSKSGEFSAASVFGSQKEKATAMSANAVGTPSSVSSPSDSLQRMPQAPTGKGKKGSTSKAAHMMSGVPSPASVSNITAPLGANSPSFAPASMPTTDPAILERFSKIEMITQRSRQNNKKAKTENFNVKKPGSFSTKELSFFLSNLVFDDFTNPSRMMSGSISQGSINTCKTRLIKSVQSHAYQGTPMALPPAENKLLMTERPSDGSVAMFYNDSADDLDVSSHDCLFILPNTLYADLLAAQYACLISREGYQVIDDKVQPIQSRFKQACSNPFVTMAMLPDSVPHEGQRSEDISGHQPNLAANNGMNQQSSSQNISNNTRLTPLGNSQGLPMSQGYLQSGQNFTTPARAQQLEQSLLQQQQSQQQQQQQQQLQSQMQQQQLQNPPSQIQQQQPQAQMQLQRSQSVLQMNPLSQFIGQNSNMQIGGSQMVSKTAPIQLHALHQAQQQQQAQLSKKSMMGMSLGNNMMGLGGLGNVMGIGGVRGISSPMSPMAGLTNIGPNQMNLGSAANFNVGFRPGSIHPHSAMLASKMRMAHAQNRGNLFGAQAGMTGLPGSAGMTGQVLPNTMGMSMLSQTLNRPNVNPLQRTVMSTMGPPKIPGANIYMTPQQLQIQQQLQHQHHLQQMQQQEQQQLQQQPQISSPLQQQQQPQVSSPSVVGSPPMSMQQQMSSQQMSQQTVSPQQLSAGALQQMNTNSAAGPGPASPQLSSQTHGSIGSISSSPMEQLQGTNKASSMNTGQ